MLATNFFKEFKISDDCIGCIWANIMIDGWTSGKTTIGPLPHIQRRTWDMHPLSPGLKTAILTFYEIWVSKNLRYTINLIIPIISSTPGFESSFGAWCVEIGGCSNERGCQQRFWFNFVIHFHPIFYLKYMKSRVRVLRRGSNNRVRWLGGRKKSGILYRGKRQQPAFLSLTAINPFTSSHCTLPEIDWELQLNLPKKYSWM